LLEGSLSLFDVIWRNDGAEINKLSRKDNFKNKDKILVFPNLDGHYVGFMWLGI